VLKLLTSIFGSRNQRLLRQYGKLVAAANALDEGMRAIPDEGYPALTTAFQERLAKGETLDQLLPEAFAAVREAARRTIGLRHFDVQLVGGLALHQGKIAEMRTGEGKTLVATLPVYLNALAGKGVHVVTVNDYLASRDAEWMAPVYRFLGFSVGVIRAGQSQDEKRAAYACDITYGTNNEYGFDYLRDNLAFRLEDRVQRGLQFAIVDEVDSILIDEARTPLIISGPAEESTELYLAINKLVPRLTRAAAEESADGPGGVYVTTVNSGTFGGDLKAGDVILKAQGAPVGSPTDVANALASAKGAPRVELEVWRGRGMETVQVTLPADGKVMVEGQGASMVVQGAALRMLGDSQRETLGVGGDYWVDEKQKQVHLTEVGHHTIEQMFAEAGLLQGGGSLYDAGNIRLMHHLNAALRAHAIYHKDIEYIVRNDEVIIVDEFTGRTMPGRRWSDGLHQAVEAKEGVEVREENQTIASVTFQNYFRMYGKLAGMTGTADTEAYEFQQIYGLEVVVIPTHRPMVRKDHSDLVYLTQQDKFDAIVEDIRDCIAREQPVLVGTASIEASELLSGLLKKQSIPHEVLNAKQHEREAQIVAQAGRPGAVTIATNMAGRGTDIVLGGRPEAADPAMPDDAATVQKKHTDWQERHAKVVAAGGLHIVGTERHESRRIDNQLRGRSGRQGDPGSSRFYLSLDDNLMRIFGDPTRMKALLSRVGMKPGEAIESALLTRQIERAQRKVEAYNFDLRKNLLEYDDVANDQRKVIYGQRNELMAADDIADTIAALRAEVVGGLVAQAVPPESIEDHWDLPTLQATLERDFAIEVDVVGWMAADRGRGARELETHVLELLEGAYAAKEGQVGAPDLRRIERTLMLQMVDSHWREHLGAMDYMRQGIFLRSYAQKNPKQEYKREAFEMFSSMLDRIKFAVVTLLSRMQVRSEAEIEAEEAERQARLAKAMQFQHAAPPTADLGVDPAVAAAGGRPAASSGAPEPAGPATFQRALPKIGRNDPCPCGSGRKYKQCHGQLAGDEPAFAPDIGRNDPCPCGSGQKYKHCHGKIESA
jgi:preprotein translocase subunit SecA